MWIFQLIKEGGFIMYPLLFCSVLVWAVAIEKFWFIAKFKKEENSIQEMIIDFFQQNKIDECRGICHSAHPFIGNPYLAVLSSVGDKDNWEQNIGRRVSETQMGLKRFLWVLGTIGNSAPFIGLFGTVIG